MSDGVCAICGEDYIVIDAKIRVGWCRCEGFQAHDHEIERLRERIEELEGFLDTKDDEIERLRERIQDLETALENVASIYGHRITTEEINAAVEWVGTGTRYSEEAAGALAELNIVRCECKREIDHWTEGEGSATTVICPDCKDKGWVIGCA